MAAACQLGVQLQIFQLDHLPGALSECAEYRKLRTLPLGCCYMVDTQENVLFQKKNVFVMGTFFHRTTIF